MTGGVDMSEPKPFASLSPSLLARKGAARPAMRPQIQPMNRFHDLQQELAADHAEDDLGWNDMGHDEPLPAPGAQVVAISEAAAPVSAPVPEVVRQQEAMARKVAAPVALAAVPYVPAPVRRSALSDGRRAAFTLRVDAERHLRLRLACTIRNRSAQQLVTEALDRLIDELPEVAALAEQVSGKRSAVKSK